MQRLKRLFSDSECAAVNRAVQEAESETSAEIVPVIAASSGRYDRPEDIVGLWFAVFGLALVWLVSPTQEPAHGRWGVPSPVWQLVALAATVVIGFVAGAFLGSRIDWLRRLFTPARQMREEVVMRARAVFFDQRVHHTAARSGVLLYVSLFERMAAVIADEPILQTLGQDRIDALCADLTARLRTGTSTEALCETARLVGRQLAPLLPRSGNDVNELADALQLID